MAEKKWYDNAVMVNRDPNWTYRANITSAENCRTVFESVFSRFGEGAITDVMLGVLEQTTMVPSKHLMWRGEKFLQKIENGHEVSYPDHEKLYKPYAEFGVDGVQIFIDEMHKLGIRPWISLRVNDVHFGHDETSFLHSDMFYEEVAAGHHIGDHYGYYGRAFNFKHDRYRNALLGFIKELLDKYDMFGIEMDFMREIYCFDYLGDPDGIQDVIMDFMRTVKAYALEAEKRVGHDIKVSIRTCRDPEDAYIFGFDIKRMADEGLIDIVVPTPRWDPTDSGMPIRKWKALLGDSVGIIAGMETNNFKSSINTAENEKAYAASFYAQGADGIYFNNHEAYNDRNRTSWRVNRDTCLKGRRDFVVTSQDCAAYKSEAYKPLPFRIGYSNMLPLEIGKVKPTDKVVLTIDFEGDELPEICINGFRANSRRVVEPLVLRTAGQERWMCATENIPLEYDFTGFSTDSKAVLGFIGSGKINYIRVTIVSK